MDKSAPTSDPIDNCSCTERHTDPQCAVHTPRGTGALTPPDFSWQENRTAGEIASINMLLHVREVLSESSDVGMQKLVKQIDGTLRYIKVKS